MEQRNNPRSHQPHGQNNPSHLEPRYQYSPEESPPIDESYDEANTSQMSEQHNHSKLNKYTHKMKDTIWRSFKSDKHNRANTVDTNEDGTPVKLGFGLRIRKMIYRAEEVCAPIVKKVIPNFIIAHYVYILLWIIVGSVVVYPQKNLDYVDALMFVTGACTQGGLNTKQLNDLKLYQQIVIYILCMFTTPIFIHSCLTFIRLYWYEKRFDDIHEKSIMQYHMRRDKTIANLRSKTKTMTMADIEAHNRNYESHNAQEGLTARMKRFENKQRQTSKNSTDKTSSSSSDKKESYYSEKPLGIHNIPEDAVSDADYDDDVSPFDKLPHLNTGPFAESTPIEELGPRDVNKHVGLRTNFIATDYDDDEDDEEEEDDTDDEEYDTDEENSDDDVVDDVEEEDEDGDEYDGFNETMDSPSDHTPNIKFGELPKPNKKSGGGIAAPKQSIYNRNLNDIADETKRRGNRKKYRRLLKERKLRKLKKKSGKGNNTNDDHQMGKITESQETDFNFSIPSPFRKKLRSLSVPVYDNPKFGVTPEEEEVEKVKNEKIPHSHTIHMPEFSKKIFSNFDTGNNRNQNAEEEIELDSQDGNPMREDTDNNHEYASKSFLKQRRASFFGRSLTGASRRPSTQDIDEMTDDEFLNNYVTKIPTNYLSWKPTVGRNSKFIALSGQQKQELGGVEYQSMKLLSKILVAYYAGFHILGVVFFVAFADTKANYKTILREDGVSPTWWAFFTSMSSFNDLGYTLNPTSMMLYAQNAYVLVVSAFLILIGNTAFPIALRLIIWCMRFVSRPLTMRHNSLSFLLEHPRRCFTLLFPSGPTWWLVVVLVILNLFDWILFIILDYTKPALDYLPHGYQILAGLYQSIATRTAGFNVVDLAMLHPAIQLSYLVMMYISVLPLAISIRRTNVYEEQSLGVYNREEEAEQEGKPKLKFIGAHLRKQLSFDLWFLFLAIFIICIAEGGKIMAGDIRFGVFQIMFEVTSAYGTVGLSLGYPNSNSSFCGQFNKVSKLVIIATLIRGRHRGLPNSIDRAIMLSTEKLDLRDDLEAYHAMRRTSTAASDNLHSMFPTISRVVTNNRPANFERQATISENIRQGNIPWNDIIKQSGKFAGKIASNLLTVSGTPATQYSRQFTQYNGYAGSTFSRNRSRSVNHSRHYYENGAGGGGDSHFDYDDEEDEDASFDSEMGERIPLNTARHEEDEMHGNFMNRLHNNSVGNHSGNL